GTFEVDTRANAPEYIQVISNEFKALAYIYEQALMKASFEMALKQGLPASQATQASNPAQPQQPTNNGFVPAFSLSNVGTPNPVPANPTPQTQTNVQVPLSNEKPAEKKEESANPAPAPIAIGANDLPWA